ncbi:hypothetical protein VKT23_001394 [Stygiomarasmius scandens]|uniref:Uncharacterized protein n=1 Tax=Marasmiellus scandens TaxID=2682957 RepID=A0ABR1JZ44_9AGAR
MAGLDMYANYGQPLIADLASQMYNFSTFGEEVAAKPVKEAQPASMPELTKPALDTDKLYTFSPETPMLDSVNPASLYPSPQLPVSKEFSPAPSTSTTTRTHCSQATGTRKNITPSSLVPIDTPTQSHHYVTPYLKLGATHLTNVILSNCGIRPTGSLYLRCCLCLLS